MCTFGRRKQRVLLSVLLLHANKPISTERLVDLLWGERPPPSAAQNLHSYVSDLRRGLTDDPGEDSRIQRRNGQYVLRVEPGELDAALFEELAEAGFQAARNGRHAFAAERFVRALGLWSGEAALENLPLPDQLRAETERLERLRLGVLEAGFEARLALGQHREVVPELEVATNRHPLSERLWELRLLALYRAERRAEAVQVYRQARDRLAAELNVEPGRDLQRVHRQVLDSDPALDPPAREARPERPERPAQLPADIATFTGRDSELSQVLDLLAGDEAPPNAVLVAAIDGMAGIGKTTLAVHAAHRLAAGYPDGQLFIDLHGYTKDVPPVDPGDALERLLRSLGSDAPATLDERAALWRSLLANRRMLIVLDNAATEAQVRPLLPGSSGSLVLVTSRRRLSGLDDIHPISLDVLALPDAIALFVRAAGDARTAGQPTDQIAEAVQLCGRLPLAIRIAASRLRGHPAWDVAHLVERLGRQQRLLSELTAGERSVASAVGLSYAQLDPEQQRLFRLLGSHPGADFERYAAAALAGTTVERAERLLDELLDAQLLQQHRLGRYQFHDLVRALAASIRAEQEPERERERADALDRLFGYYTHTAAAAVDRLYPREFEPVRRTPSPTTPLPSVDTLSAATAWLDSELNNLFAVGSHGRPAHTMELSSTLHWHLRVRSGHTNAEALHERALRAAERVGDARGAYDALIGLAHAVTGQGRHTAAVRLFERALEIARDRNDRLGERHAVNALANVYLILGLLEPAADCFAAALDISNEINDTIGELGALLGLGNLHLTAGSTHRAVESFRRALRICRAIGESAGEIRSLGGLARTYWAAGDYAQAVACYEDALEIAVRMGDAAHERGILIGLARCQRALGQLVRAAELGSDALGRARAADDRNGLFEALQTLGEIYCDTGNPGRAMASHQEALHHAEALQQPVDQARAHNGLGHAYRALSRLGPARYHWQQALTILGQVGITHSELVDTQEIHANLEQLGESAPAEPVGWTTPA